MGLHYGSDGANVFPVALDKLVRLSKAAFQIRILQTVSMLCYHGVLTNMGEHRDAVQGEMDVRLESMCANIYRAAKRGHGVLWELGFVPTVRNGLRQWSLHLDSACGSKGSFNCQRKAAAGLRDEAYPLEILAEM
jgi:hypothetical protein